MSGNNSNTDHVMHLWCNANKYILAIFALLEMLLERHDIMNIKYDSSKEINYELCRQPNFNA